MCKLKSHGGMRCSKQLTVQSKRLAVQMEKLEEIKKGLEDSRPSLRSTIRIDRRIARIEAQIALRQHRIADLEYAFYETADGQRWLEDHIRNPETSETEREVLKDLLAKVREDAAVQKRFIAENLTKIDNTIRAAKQAGFSESDIESIAERYLNRDMNKLPYSTTEAKNERKAVIDERDALIASIYKLKTEVMRADYLDEAEKEDACWEIDAEHEAKMNIINERVRLAKRKYDATPAGLQFLKKGYERLVAKGEISEASEIKARIKLAEREIRTRSDERNARGSLKRAIFKAAKKANSDDAEKVWNACKSIKAVNLDGTSYTSHEDTDTYVKAPSVHITPSDYASLVSDVSTMEEYRKVPVQDAVKDLMRKRILENPVTRQQGKSLEESNSEADTIRDGSVGRYRTTHKEKRDVGTYPPLTHKEYEQIKSVAKTLEMTASSYMRAMALGKGSTPFAIQNDRSMRMNWNRKITASTNYLANAG